MLLRKEDVEMRTDFDFSPLFQSSVGFDTMLDALLSAARVEHLDNYPPYNIEKLGENEYRVTISMAGFRPDEITVTARQNLLTVSAEKKDRQGEGSQRQVLHRGIATRAFERRFNLADFVEVTGASLADGLLTIELRRELPEAMRPRRIQIASGGAPLRQIEGQVTEERNAA
jgi:molecular chaperone IbpA